MRVIKSLLGVVKGFTNSPLRQKALVKGAYVGVLSPTVRMTDANHVLSLALNEDVADEVRVRSSHDHKIERNGGESTSLYSLYFVRADQSSFTGRSLKDQKLYVVYVSQYLASWLFSDAVAGYVKNFRPLSEYQLKVYLSRNHLLE